MSTFFQELAKKLAERWVTLLVIPGVLYVAITAVGVRLGHSHALDYARLRVVLTDATGWMGRQPSGSQAVAAVVVLLAAAGAGLLVQASAVVTRTVWLGLWPRPLGPLRRRRADSRRRRWLALVGQRRTLEHAHPSANRTPEQQHLIDAAAARVNRFALAEPGRPTWMGDRVHALEAVALNRYGLDLEFAWPRLWLVLPDTTRTEITAANAAFATATATGTWAWPCLLLGAVWWPALFVGVGIGITGWIRARAAVADLTSMSEAAVDLHGRSLATALGVAETGRAGPLTLDEGRQLTALLRKGR
ncbi:hypothetical protein [Nocardia sp. alder85J]|uniref:hypothetical protein n=1 Tax=Nocardia sp. alder85J TaxID=2862949 RepID=UPI001CD7A0F4|nr:hypothetical protein [Nocardia sp. alder85J]MCX4091389.1 hypothetical protein [Nocardia sp. alder85J]